MSQPQSKYFARFTSYVEEQMERMRLAMQRQEELVGKMEDVNAAVRRVEQRLGEMEGKMRLMEVYQCENFRNNERIFNTQPHQPFLEQMQINILSSEERQAQRSHELGEQMVDLNKRIGEIEAEVERRGKSGLLKSRKEMGGVKCDSTKDVSMDSGEVRLQSRIHEYINQRLKMFQKKYALLQEVSHKSRLQTHYESSCDKNQQLEMQLKQENVYQINLEKKHNDGFTNTIDNYFNPSPPSTKRDNNKPIKLNKNSSKSKSKKDGSSSKKSISLKSVSEYFKMNTRK